jgi:hypothetical protein
MQYLYNNAILKLFLHEYTPTVGQLQVRLIGIVEEARQNIGIQRYLY